MDDARIRAALTTALPAALLAYAAYALLVARWWLSGAAAPVVAALLWTRHRRARFSAYILLSVVVMRGTIRGQWGAVAFAAAAILALQLPAARRTWPRVPTLVERWRRRSTSTEDCSKMTRP